AFGDALQAPHLPHSPEGRPAAAQARGADGLGDRRPDRGQVRPRGPDLGVRGRLRRPQPDPRLQGRCQGLRLPQRDRPRHVDRGRPPQRGRGRHPGAGPLLGGVRQARGPARQARRLRAPRRRGRSGVGPHRAQPAQARDRARHGHDRGALTSAGACTDRAPVADGSPVGDRGPAVFTASPKRCRMTAGSSTFDGDHPLTLSGDPVTDTRFHRPLAAHRPLATHRFRARLRSRALTGAAAAAAITLVVPLGARAQSEIPDLGGIPGSTGAPASTSDSLGSLAPATPLEPGPEVVVEPVLDGLTIPWDVVRDPGGVVVTGERDSGAVHAVHPDGTTSAVEADFSALFTESESGLTGMALASDFDTSREVYTCHSSADEQDNRVTSWTAAEDWSSLDSPEVLVDDIPLNDGGQHSGCRILAHPDGSLYIGT